MLRVCDYNSPRIKQTHRVVKPQSFPQWEARSVAAKLEQRNPRLSNAYGNCCGRASFSPLVTGDDRQPADKVRRWPQIYMVTPSAVNEEINSHFFINITSSVTRYMMTEASS